MDKEINIDIDLPTILSSAKEIGLHDLVSNKEEVQHLSGIMKFPILLDNVRKLAVKVRKLQIARMMYDQLETTKDRYSQVRGDEPISQILGIAEESIFDFTSLLNDGDDAPQKVFQQVEDRLNELSENPIDQIGIPTGFTRYDFAIGGGLWTLIILYHITVGAASGPTAYVNVILTALFAIGFYIYSRD